MADTVSPPAIPERRLFENGWAEAERTVETVASVPGLKVLSHTVVYDDIDLRRRVIEAGGADRMWAFFFASRLEFRPALGVGLASFAGSRVSREAREGFADELRARGFEDVVEGERSSLRTASGTKARMTTYNTRLQVGEATVEATGHLAVWHDGEFRIAGGVYPESGLGVEVDTETAAEELFDLIRAVGEPERR